MSDPLRLTRREREIMEIVYARGEVSANQVLADLPDPPAHAAVRTFLRILEDKGHLTHRKEGREFIYRPTRAHRQVARSALRHMLSTFFGGSIEEALATHLADPKTSLSPEELKRLRDLVEKARSQGE